MSGFSRTFFNKETPTKAQMLTTDNISASDDLTNEGYKTLIAGAGVLLVAVGIATGGVGPLVIGLAASAGSVVSFIHDGRKAMAAAASEPETRSSSGADAAAPQSIEHVKSSLAP